MEHELGPNFAPGLDRQELCHLLEHAIQALEEVIMVDALGRIVYISDEYSKNMEISIPDALGKPINEVLDHTDIPSVLKSGHATKGVVYQRKGKNFWISRYPIRDGEKIIGAVAQCILGTYLETDQIEKKLRYVTRELNYYKEKYRQASTARYTADNIVTGSRTVLELKETIAQIALTKSTVLITGESGTGKEVFANAIHSLSSRKDKPFVRLNCAAIPDNLLEAELFGYEEGAFTGAVKGGKIGDFEAANGGTILLDEVDALTPNLQAKLLRVIQEKEVKKVGSTKPVPIDVRFIFATNKDLLKLVEEKSFREDFYYRINVINLKLPPLRERVEDIPLLTDYFIKRFNSELDMHITGISPEALALLQGYSWPGNIRELENCLERAFNYARGGGLLQAEHIKLTPSHAAEVVPLSLREARAYAERKAIQRALSAAGGNKREAARLLEIDRSVLYEKLKRYNLTDGDGGEE